MNAPKINTILAALRTYQRLGYARDNGRPADIDAIATDNDELAALTEDEIDMLCETLNTMSSRYTVVLIYPDYLSDQYGEDFYVDTVMTESAEAAVAQVRATAAAANEDADSAEDFALVHILAHGLLI